MRRPLPALGVSRRKEEFVCRGGSVVDRSSLRSMSEAGRPRGPANSLHTYSLTDAACLPACLLQAGRVRIAADFAGGSDREEDDEDLLRTAAAAAGVGDLEA